MWKLTITQTKKTDKYTFDQSVEFFSNDINELVCLVLKLGTVDNEKTSYKIESVKGGEGECSLEN